MIRRLSLTPEFASCHIGRARQSTVWIYYVDDDASVDDELRVVGHDADAVEIKSIM